MPGFLENPKEIQIPGSGLNPIHIAITAQGSPLTDASAARSLYCSYVLDLQKSRAMPFTVK